MFKDGEILRHLDFSTDKTSTSYEYAMKLNWVLEKNKTKTSQIEGIAIASVVPSLTSVFEDAINFLFNLKPFIVESGIRTGISIDTENPKEVGADLICNVVAIDEEYGHCGIAVDFGTATTFSVINNKKFLGVAIAPGVGTSAYALFEKTAKLPQVDIIPPKSSIGKNTITAMQAGIVYGFAGLVNGILEKQIKELKIKPVIVATGGWAKRIVPYTKHIKKIDPYLTLKGLYYLFKKNQEM